MLTRSSPAGALSAGGRTPPCHREPAHLSVVPSGGTADERRPHPGRGDPHDAPLSEARGRPATDGPGPCVPSHVQWGCLSPRHRAWTQERCACSGGVSHPSEHVSSRVQSLPLQASHVARPKAVPQGTPAALPSPSLRRLSSTSPRRTAPHSARARGAAGLPGGRSGFRGAWSQAHRPGGWPMDNVDAQCHGWSGILPPTRVTKKRTWTSPRCWRLPVCAVSRCVESAARSGSSCS